MPDTTPRPDEFYARAQALVPLFAERAAKCEALRCCPAETIDALHQDGLLQLCRPARYGVYEYGWDVLCRVNRILARGCGSQAWVANVLNEHTQLVGAFALEAQDEVWGKHRDARIAASVAPSGKARRVAGGAVLSGKFAFASGIDYADWLICGALLKARFQAAFIARMALEAVEALFAAAGGHAIYSSSPLQRQLRDLI